MAAANLGSLIDKMRRLPPDKLRQVEALVEHLESEEGERPNPFRAAWGNLSPEDALVISTAVDDCERIDPRGW